MWAQLIKSRLKPGQGVDELRRVNDQVAAYAKQRPGWIRSFVLQNQKNPQELYNLVVFESEEQARQTESSAETTAIVELVRGVVEGVPEYIDLIVLAENTR